MGCHVRWCNGKSFDEVEYPGIELEHAGILETSLTLYFRPDLCKMDRFVEDSVDGTLGYNIYPPSKCKVTETGLLTTARTSTAEKGAAAGKRYYGGICYHYKQQIRLKESGGYL